MSPSVSSGGSLLDQGIERLLELLGPGWTASPYRVGAAQSDSSVRTVDDGIDAVIALQSPGNGSSSGAVLVEVKRELSPVEVVRTIAPKAALARRLTGEISYLVISEWLTPRTQAALTDYGMGYVDLAGNASLRLPRLGVSVNVAGRNQSPRVKRTQGRGIGGRQAGALVRALIDVSPPYRATELAEATGLALPYVSRLLDTIEQMGLLVRERRLVVQVDWAELLAARSATHRLAKIGTPYRLATKTGPDEVLHRLAGSVAGLDRWAITGSYAARRVAPLAIGGQLMLYASITDVQQVRKTLNVLQAPDTAAADLLIYPEPDPLSALWSGATLEDDLPYVALSQTVLDCNGGSGRMPAEGAAVLEYMKATEPAWRGTSLPAWTIRSMGSPAPSSPEET